ncbi:hypothetical protein VPHD69_0179 [Vibrio phage D69]
MSKRANRNFKKRQASQKAVRADFLGIESKALSFDLEACDLATEWDQEVTEPKGQRGGRCNVTACQRPGAVFQNVGMISTGGSWYCRSCATDINMVNNRDVENGAGYTLFPAFDEVLARYKEVLRSTGKDPHDIENYADIEQNPWGNCYHFSRDKWLDAQIEEMIDDNTN